MTLRDETMNDMTDQQLLEQVLGGGPSAALETLFTRHSALVKGTCLRVLENSHDVDDAIQSVFLAFARQAASIRNRQNLGGWFYGTALRCAHQLKRKLAIRHRHEAEWQKEYMHAQPKSEATWEELRSVLDL